MMSKLPVLIAGQWRAAKAARYFSSVNPTTGEELSEEYPVSEWEDCDAALTAAAAAAAEIRALPAETIAGFLERYADRLEARKDELVACAHEESGLPVTPRLADVELPRTTGQLRQAAAAATEGTWAMPTIDSKTGIRSALEPLGPVLVFGPNNFPFAFNSAAGGDFAAAIAAGNPVIAKGNSSHPRTTRLLAEEAFSASQETGMPEATVQLIYRTSHDDGSRLVADPRTGATGYTGSRSAGLVLKEAADKAGKPVYLELSSVNPVLVLPGALEERGDQVADELTGSCLMGSGQFCTSPSLVLVFAGERTEAFVDKVRANIQAGPVNALLSSGVKSALVKSIDVLVGAGAELLTGGKPVDKPGSYFENTLLRVSGETFLKDPHTLQTEAFGNASMIVVVEDVSQAAEVLETLEGNLTGCVYSHTGADDDAMYDRLSPLLRSRVGRLLNDKMPTGVAVSPAMNHGGPFPATGHPGFTAVGIPAALRRFGMVACYDNVRPARLPELLQDKNPNGSVWRYIDGVFTQGDVGS